MVCLDFRYCLIYCFIYFFFVFLVSDRYRLDVVDFDNLQYLKPVDFEQHAGEKGK
jgi:hypothetical protein